MNRTAARRERRSASIAEAALRDPSTAEILRDCGLSRASHPFAAGAAHTAPHGDSPDSLADSLRLFDADFSCDGPDD